MRTDLLHRYNVLLRLVQEQAFTLNDLLEGRTAVNVEGDGGRDVFRARQLGLFTCNVKGVDIIATCEAEAAPLIHYLEQGGVYGSLEFSRLLGYDEEQLAQYEEFLKLQAELGIPPWGYRKMASIRSVGQLAIPLHRQETNYSCGAAAVREVLLYYGMDVPEAYLRLAMGSNPQDGTNPSAMVDYLNRAGLRAEARQMSIPDLHACVDAGVPVIIDLQAWADEPTDYSSDLEDGHYAVLSGYEDGMLFFADPAHPKPVFLAEQDLGPRWHDVEADGTITNCLGIAVMGQEPQERVAARYLVANLHGKNVALMKFLSGVSARAGFGDNAYVVGGAVRNWVIKQPIKDIDLLVDTVALGHDTEWVANQIAKAIPADTNLTTNQYGVAILTVKGEWDLDGFPMQGEVIEIAAARKESYGGEGGKGYKPDTVEPATVQEDVVRREFTFNTLMWRLMDLAQGPDKAQIIDLTGCGLSDLQEGRMQCPADPDKVFADDPSRLIRIVKFVTRYGFKLTPDTEAAAKRQAPKLANVPHNAVSKLLAEVLVESKAKQAIALMDHLGLLGVIRKMVETVAPFRDALNNWGNAQSVQYMFNLMDIGLVTKAKVGFLPPDQQKQVREIATEMTADEAENFLAVLKQPGKVLNMAEIAKDLGLAGAAMKSLMDLARETLLGDPKLVSNPSSWGATVREGYRALHKQGGAQRVAARWLAAADDNEPTNESLWEESKETAKERYKIWPSAYAVGHALAIYKEKGGKWRKKKKEARGKAKKDVGHGGLDEWFSGHGEGKNKNEGEATWGDWVSISPVKKKIETELADGTIKTETVYPGDIVGPCGISEDPNWKSVTRGGKDPLKCMPRQKAHDMDKAERAELAKGKMKAEKEQGNGKKPVMTPTFEKPEEKKASRLTAAEGKYDKIDFQPPKSVANQAEKGLELREKASPSNKGGLSSQEAGKQGIGSGVQRAVNLKNRDNVTPETIGKMLGFFARHQKNKGLSPENRDTPWNDKGYVAWLLWGGDEGWTWAKKVKEQMEKADAEALKKSASRVAARHIEAAQFSEWLKWIVQPFAVLAKHHKEFIYGPVDDAMDLVIKELAPKLVRSLTEKEVESDVDKFLDGAIDGRNGKTMADDDLDYRSGYAWGRANADDKELAKGQLPAYMKRQVIQSSVEDFKQRITERVLMDALKKAWHAVNPMTTFRAIKEAVKKHGWKLGVGFALFEVFEHFVLPSLLSALFDDPRYLALASLPIGEIVYAIVFRILGRTPDEVNKADEGGYLEWYEQEFGPVRLAALAARPS